MTAPTDIANSATSSQASPHPVVTVRIVDGKELVFQLERNCNIGELKQRIAQREKGLCLEEQELVFKGKQLEDQRLVDDLTLENDVVVVHFLWENCTRLLCWTCVWQMQIGLVVTGGSDGLLCYW